MKTKTKTRTRREYTDDFKEKVVNMVVVDGKTASGTSRELNIPEATVSAWIKKKRTEKTGKTEKVVSNELHKLRKENTKLLRYNKMLKEVLIQILDIKEEK